MSKSLFQTSFWRGVCSPLIHRDLLHELVSRDVAARYKASRLGYIWTIAQPLLMIAVYALAFTHFLGVRWSSNGDPYEFTFMLFCALIVYGFFSESVSRSVSIVPANVNYIKKLVFPAELLPWTVIGVALVHALVSWMVWITAYALLIGAPPVTIVAAPLVMLSMLPATAAVCMVCACFGVFFRDLQYIVNFVLQAMLFLSPIFFRVDAVPMRFRWVVEANPLTTAIEQLRNVMYLGQWPVLHDLIGFALLGTAAYAVGVIMFLTLSDHFSDAL